MVVTVIVLVTPPRSHSDSRCLISVIWTSVARLEFLIAVRCADAIHVISNRPQYGQSTHIVSRPLFTVSGLVSMSGCAQIMHLFVSAMAFEPSQNAEGAPAVAAERLTAAVLPGQTRSLAAMSPRPKRDQMPFNRIGIAIHRDISVSLHIHSHAHLLPLVARQAPERRGSARTGEACCAC